MSNTCEGCRYYQYIESGRYPSTTFEHRCWSEPGHWQPRVTKSAYITTPHRCRHYESEEQ